MMNILKLLLIPILLVPALSTCVTAEPTPIVNVDTVPGCNLVTTNYAKDISDLSKKIKDLQALKPTDSYQPQFRFGKTSGVYPSYLAEEPSFPPVIVKYILLVNAKHKISEVFFISMSSPCGPHVDNQSSFINAVKEILYKRTKLVSAPYYKSGKPIPFSYTGKLVFRHPKSSAWKKGKK